MSQAFLIALIAHMLFGLAGIVAFTSFLLLLSRQEWNDDRLRRYAGIGFVALIVAWVSGGYYYTTYYGKSVKPIIIEGTYPWAHQVIMEAKEHAFLFLPFLALVLWIVAWQAGKAFEENEKLRKAVILLTVVTMIIGSAMALGGLVISGSVEKRSLQPTVRSYGECVNAGYPVMLSYPSACRIPDGKIFIQPVQ